MGGGGSKSTPFPFDLDWITGPDLFYSINVSIRPLAQLMQSLPL